MIWNEKYECMDPQELKNIQLERLRNVVNYVYEKVPFYKNRLNTYGVHWKDIKSLSDIKKLPFTTKEDLRDNYPFGLFARPLNEMKEIHVSSGTTGNPTVVGYTREDIELWMEVMARAIACAGGNPGDMIQIAYGYGLFTGGLGFHYGALKMELTIIPTSSGQTKRQLKLMQDFKPRILACTPSYALYMVDEAKEMGMEPKNSSWEIGIFGAEPWSDSIRKEIEEIWNMTALDVYGLSEIIGPGVAQECSYKDGLHIFWDVFYPEVINPETGEEVKEGEDGELVITTLTKIGMPLLRYRTRDIVSIKYDRCKCGRTSPRISKIKGRTDDMIVVRGINVFPSQIEHVLLGIEGTQPHYQIIVDRKAHSLDELEIWVEVEEKIFSDEVKKLEELQEKIKKEIESVLGIIIKVKLVEPKTIERSMGKAKRVIDKRQL
ncbi:MAG: phenylacetate--CoA ligase [Candidatus Omnitrophica bacterium 4484_49]|nr:phenylacetate--CoA ligase [Candidatus Omnitrophota bacterium]OQX83016.1 MAG: phenylacetate--CoA ligase [Candidatus Omnitrophica bacterium 4484_49]